MGFLNLRRSVKIFPNKGNILRSINRVNLTVPDLIGLSSIDAQSAIVAAGYVVGQIILTTGNVTAQSMPAGTKTVVHSTIDITLTA